jgi:hypothetical protein
MFAVLLIGLTLEHDLHGEQPYDRKREGTSPPRQAHWEQSEILVRQYNY